MVCCSSMLGNYKIEKSFLKREMFSLIFCTFRAKRAEMGIKAAFRESILGVTTGVKVSLDGMHSFRVWGNLPKAFRNFAATAACGW